MRSQILSILAAPTDFQRSERPVCVFDLICSSRATFVDILQPTQTALVSFYCQRCGTELEQARMCATLWLSFLNCNACAQAYLHVADPRWIYPLQFLELGVLPKAMSASEEALVAAAATISFIDYKTVSIVAFEKALLELCD